MDNVVLNLLVYDKRVKDGDLQNELINEGIKLGFNQFEIRREYFSNIKKESIDIKKLANEFNLELFYSVPDEVFKQGEINPNLQNYLEEAKAFGAKHIKWNIGDFENFEGELTELTVLTNQGIEVNIENDQTELSGKIKAIETFMKAVTNEEVNIGYVYDLGNWPFVGEDETEAAKKLAQYVKYIHVKDVKKQQAKPLVKPLDQGDIDWRACLEILPSDVPVAIEYPTKSSADILAAKKLLEGA